MAMKLYGTNSLCLNHHIGLEFTDGRVRYAHRLSLVNAGGYFAACFGDGGVWRIAGQSSIVNLPHSSGR